MSFSVGADINVWSYHSVDDGKNFAGTSFTISQNSGATPGQDHYVFTDRTIDIASYPGHTAAVRIVENNTLIAATVHRSGYYYDAFIVCDPSIPASAQGNKQAVYFKRGENRGQPAWV